MFSGYGYYRNPVLQQTQTINYRCTPKLREKDTTTNTYKYDSNELKKIHYPYISEINEMKKLIDKYKDLKCDSGSNTKKKKCSETRKDLVDKINKKNKSINKNLSTHLKHRITRKIDKLKHKIKAKRINAIACAVKYLIEILNDSNCYTQHKFPNLNSFIETFKKYISEKTNKKSNNKNEKYTENSISLLYYIITENKDTDIDKITSQLIYLNKLNPYLLDYFKDFITKIQECKE